MARHLKKLQNVQTLNFSKHHHDPPQALDCATGNSSERCSPVMLYHRI